MSIACTVRVASFPGPLHFFGYTNCHRAWFLKLQPSLSNSKDGCVSLHFTGDFVSAVSLWHKGASCEEKLYTRSVDSVTLLVD